MIAATAGAAVVAWIVGTFLQLVVFDLEEHDLLTEAGAWGYLAGLFVVALMMLPAVGGVLLGVRARRLGEPRLGTLGIVVNCVIATYLALTFASTVLLG